MSPFMLLPTAAKELGGIGAANSNHAKAVSDNSTEAYLQKGVTISAYQLEANAGGLDDNYAEAVAGSGGGLTLVLVEAETYDNSNSLVYLGSLERSSYKAGNMSIKVEKLRINSYHNARFNSKADGISVAGIGIGNTLHITA